MPRSPAPSGFTLLEIMVALAVLAIALVALLTLRNRDLAMQAHARHLVTATSLARMKLEEVSLISGPGDQEQTGDFGEHYPGFTWEWREEPSPLPSWLELWVEVKWTEGAHRDQVTFVTYVPAPA